MKILLVDDDESLSRTLAKSLATHHYVIDTVKDGETGWVYGSTFKYDLIVLDIMLPKLDGISLCQRFRAEGYTTPILLLTAQNTNTAKVNGLDAGADDYVVKPVSVVELSARIRALLRRSRMNVTPLLTWGDLMLNPSTAEVTYQDQPLSLTGKEYEVLELLLQDSQHVFSTQEILDRIWSSNEFPSEATVRSHIRRLRQKLTAAGAPADFIATVHGRGYFLKSSEDRETADPQVQYLAFLNETWATDKLKTIEQLTILTKAIAALRANALTPELHQQAQQTAHKLAGNLGMFGLSRGMALAYQLEHLLDRQTPLHPHQAESIETLVHALRQEIRSTSSIEGFQNLPEQEKPLPRALDSHSEAGAKVMVVDDDSGWLKALPQLLHPWGFELTTLADPQQFWPVLQAVRPDILVLDLDMPDISGFDLCQALRSQPQWQRLPVVCLSVLKDSQTENQAFKLGADDYLCKPVMPTDLANRILNRLRRVRACASG